MPPSIGPSPCPESSELPASSSRQVGKAVTPMAFVQAIACAYAARGLDPAGAWAAAPVLRGAPGVAAQRPVVGRSHLSMAAAGGG